MILGLYCAGGFGGEIEGIARDSGRWEKIVYIDDDESLAGENILSFETFREQYPPEAAEILITAGEPRVRAIIFSKVKESGYHLPNLFHKMSDIIEMPELGEGNIFFAFSSIAPNNVRMGDNNVFMTFTRVGHDTTVGSNVVVATSAVIAGGITIGDGAYVGLNATLREGICVGEAAVVGMGAVAVSSVEEKVAVVGNPAKPINNKGKVFNAKNPNE